MNEKNEGYWRDVGAADPFDKFALLLGRTVLLLTGWAVGLPVALFLTWKILDGYMWLLGAVGGLGIIGVLVGGLLAFGLVARFVLPARSHATSDPPP